MLTEGADAPPFTLPAVDDGELIRFDAGEVIGRTVTLVAFYPGDFNDVCTEELCALSDMALFELDRAVTTVGISTDTAYSHRAFASEYDISFPLCSDNDGSVAEQYGVLYDEFDGHRRLAKRALFLLDAEGTVRHRWIADDPSDLPAFEELKAHIDRLNDDGSAISHYARGHDRYQRGREAFERGRAAYEEASWLDAFPAFEDASDVFEAAADGFLVAAAMAETPAIEDPADRAADRAAALSQAGKWFGKAAEAFARGDGEDGLEWQEDAVTRLQSADEVGEPVDPDRLTGSPA